MKKVQKAEKKTSIDSNELELVEVLNKFKTKFSGYLTEQMLIDQARLNSIIVNRLSTEEYEEYASAWSNCVREDNSFETVPELEAACDKIISRVMSAKR